MNNKYKTGSEDVQLDIVREKSKISSKEKPLTDDKRRLTFPVDKIVRDEKEDTIHIFTFYPNTFDEISNTELHIDKVVNIIDFIDKIQVYLGGMGRIESVTAESLEFLLHLSNEEISYENNKTIIPLKFSLFLERFDVQEYYDIQIRVTTKKCVDITLSMQCEGKNSPLNVYDSRIEEKDIINKIYVQSQYTGGEPITKNNQLVTLNFNHPIFLLYICGIPTISSIKSIHLKLDDEQYFNNNDSETNELTYTPFKDGIIILMGDKLAEDVKNNKTLNFSRIEKAKLIINSTETEEYEIRTYGFNYQIASFRGGLVWLSNCS